MSTADNLEQCSACESEWATVMVDAAQGRVTMCRRCAGLLIGLGKLMGLKTRKRPVLQELKDFIEEDAGGGIGERQDNVVSLHKRAAKP